MLALLNGYLATSPEERCVVEISELFFDDDYGLCFLAKSNNRIYYFPKKKISVYQAKGICEEAFRCGKIDLTEFGSYEDYPYDFDDCK